MQTERERSEKQTHVAIVALARSSESPSCLRRCLSELVFFFLDSTSFFDVL